MKQQEIVKNTENFIRTYFEKESSGHDWWHIHRVRNLAMQIAQKEQANLFLVEMAALLHDLDDWKLSEHGDEEPLNTIDWMKSLKLDGTIQEQIVEIVKEVSFKGAGVETKASSLEAKIVQDADRLDAMGAIGIARTFAYGGNKGRVMYVPEIKPQLHSNFEDYKKTKSPTINHFYEKLLLLKDRLNTKTAKELGEERHTYMESFLKQFYSEWNSKIV